MFQAHVTEALPACNGQKAEKHSVVYCRSSTGLTQTDTQPATFTFTHSVSVHNKKFEVFLRGKTGALKSDGLLVWYKQQELDSQSEQ